jgi:hypothetical protein
MRVHFKENKKVSLTSQNVDQNYMPHCETHLNVQMKVAIISI